MSRQKRSLEISDPTAALLLNRTRRSGKGIIGVRADESNCAYHDHKDHGQHYRILGDVLSALLQPEPA
jgi:hypothetical protein